MRLTVGIVDNPAATVSLVDNDVCAKDRAYALRGRTSGRDVALYWWGGASSIWVAELPALRRERYPAPARSGDRCGELWSEAASWSEGASWSGRDEWAG